ncbi:M48 family metallopeptidase, partial [Eubacteriales bacterium OttesenSCG-928-K08]|nr:M48 family metallopeptidase [Eubacteriales bacterium OttesenSCG-928-K08]
AVQNLSGVKITGAKTQWGSCSAKNSLCFSWRLVLVPQALIDYVVVHELAHTIEHNHSPRFWAIVAGVFSDYKELKKQLGLQAAALALEDWHDI